MNRKKNLTQTWKVTKLLYFSFFKVHLLQWNVKCTEKILSDGDLYATNAHGYVQYICNVCHDYFASFEAMRVHRGLHFGNPPIHPITGLPLSSSEDESELISFFLFGIGLVLYVIN